MLARVSNLEAFRRWRETEDSTTADLVQWITASEPTEPMRVGTAFHKALEACQPGSFERMEADGYTFLLPDAELALPAIRELRGFKDYHGLTVTGCVDCLDGTVVIDHKTTARIDPERYLAGYQWRYYLDIFEAHTFRWNLFQVREVEPRVYQVSPPEYLEAHRYPGMEMDCLTLALHYHAFAELHLPQTQKETAA